MSFFDLFRKKKDKPKVSEPEKEKIILPVPDDEPEELPELGMSDDDDPSLSTSSDDSLSFSMSKDSILEDITKDDTSDPDSITNEEITRGIALLDTYEVTSDAIKGSMGSVWKVHHKSWNADLAMKRPQPKFFAEGSEKRKENFIHECESWINLGLHPNIVSCYYVREIGGVPTIFSEWMENGSLKNRIDDGSLYEGTEEEVRARLLDIAIQFCRGLHYAHESKEHLIHQDVKPDNLLLTGSWEAKVADFGLAKARTQLQVGAESSRDGSDKDHKYRMVKDRLNPIKSFTAVVPNEYDNHYIASTVLSPDRKKLYVSSWMGVSVWDTDTWENIDLYDADKIDPVSIGYWNYDSFAVSPDGSLLAVGTNSVRLWSTTERKLVWEGPGIKPRGVAFASDLSALYVFESRNEYWNEGTVYVLILRHKLRFPK